MSGRGHKIEVPRLKKRQQRLAETAYSAGIHHAVLRSPDSYDRTGKLAVAIRVIGQEDAEGIALLAITEAAGRFDPTHKASFETFAAGRVKFALFDALERAQTIKRGYGLTILSLCDFDSTACRQLIVHHHFAKGDAS